MQTLILNHYPAVIRQIKEIQQIAKAEDIEFSKLNRVIKETSDNMFVLSANEIGVEKFEKLLSITPKAGQSLEDRKIYINFKMNQRKMSLSELTVMLAEYSTNIKLVNNMLNQEMTIEMNANEGDLEMIHQIVDEILPANIGLIFFLQLKTAVVYYGSALEEADVFELRQRQG